MTPHAVQPQGWLTTLLPILIIAVVFAIRARRMTRLRPLRLERLWIVPALYLVVVVAMFATTPPTAAGWQAAVIGVLVGASLGWLRGKSMHIVVDPQSHRLNHRASPAAFLMLLMVVLVRQVARVESSSLGFDLAVMTDALAGFGLGLFAAQRLEMFLRGRRLLGEAAALRA